MTHPLDIRIPETTLFRIRRDFHQYDGMPDIDAVHAYIGQCWEDRKPVSADTDAGVRELWRRKCVLELQAVGCTLTEAYARAAVIFGRPE